MKTQFRGADKHWIECHHPAILTIEYSVTQNDVSFFTEAVLEEM
jgi:hypothetical protein